ncbi:hypothetical protein FKB34_12165 [Glycocaulis profundi]|nr:hypothetical protein FKB34_12165 [Glycocaulis profundi]
MRRSIVGAMAIVVAGGGALRVEAPARPDAEVCPVAVSIREQVSADRRAEIRAIYAELPGWSLVASGNDEQDAMSFVIAGSEACSDDTALILSRKTAPMIGWDAIHITYSYPFPASPRR